MDTVKKSTAGQLTSGIVFDDSKSFPLRVMYIVRMNEDSGSTEW